jgi:hypothetical protein
VSPETIFLFSLVSSVSLLRHQSSERLAKSRAKLPNRYCVGSYIYYFCHHLNTCVFWSRGNPGPRKKKRENSCLLQEILKWSSCSSRVSFVTGNILRHLQKQSSPWRSHPLIQTIVFFNHYIQRDHETDHRLFSLKQEIRKTFFLVFKLRWLHVIIVSEELPLALHSSYYQLSSHLISISQNLSNLEIKKTTILLTPNEWEKASYSQRHDSLNDIEVSKTTIFQMKVFPKALPQYLFLGSWRLLSMDFLTCKTYMTDNFRCSCPGSS